MRLPGFRFEERMEGRYQLVVAPSEERPIDFTLTARAPSLSRFLRKPEAEARGEANLVGFADHQPARGTILIDPVLGRRIAYDFEFRGNDGQTYRLKGQKDIALGRLAQSMSTLPAGIFDSAGARIGDAVVHFRYSSQLLRFLRSWRLT